jgi:hypothetical protein
MPRFLFLLLVAYLVYRLLDFFVLPIIRQAFKRSNSDNIRKEGDRESDKDWGGKYVDYEEVKGDEEEKKS